jgi:tartrate-resistant acid phosphatase type 5
MRLVSATVFLLALQGCGGRSAPGDAAPISDLSLVDGANADAGADAGPPPLRFAVIGDYGSGSDDERRVADLVKSWTPDFIVTAGDNNYPNGEAATIDGNIGQFYADYIGGYLGRYGIGSTFNRFWPCIGNHDRYSTPPLQPYLDYFHVLPGNKRYYDVDFGRVHLFVVDSNDPRDVPLEPDGFTADSVQAMWLKDRLAASTACYKIVVFHHPPYSSGDYFVAEMRWPFKAWGADVIITGHEHFYERLEVDGFLNLINGIGGADKFPFRPVADPTSQLRFNADWGAQLVTATPTGITYEFRTVGGTVIDSVTVPKSCP